jgi:hypothetical protein
VLPVGCVTERLVCVDVGRVAVSASCWIRGYQEKIRSSPLAWCLTVDA